MGFYTILLVVHTIIVLFMIGIILIQRTDSDGLGGLGGGGGNQFLSGRAKANLLTRTTSLLAGAFMLTSLVLAVMASRMSERSIVDTVPADAPIAAEQKAHEHDEPVKAPVSTATPAVPKPE